MSWFRKIHIGIFCWWHRL